MDERLAPLERDQRIVLEYGPALLASLARTQGLTLVVDGYPAAGLVALLDAGATQAAQADQPWRVLGCAPPADAPPAALPPACALLDAPLAEALPELLRLAGASAVLLLTTTATLPLFTGLDALARRLQRTDVLVHWSPAAVQAWLALRGEAGLPHAATQALDRLFASRHWREIIDSLDDLAARDAALTELYRQQLTELGGGRWRWSAALPMRSAWGAVEFFWMFASAERRAGPLMGAALYTAAGWYQHTADAALFRASAGRPVQTGLFDAPLPAVTELQAATVAELATTLRTIADQQPRLWTYADLVDHMLRRFGWFGQVDADLLLAACLLLEAEGRLRRRTPETPWSERTLLRLE